jgi:uncharacterized protein (DUF1501 family)
MMTTGAAGLAGVAGFPGLAIAEASTDKRLLFIILRGGLDGLTAFPPYGDPQFQALRGALAIPAPGQEDGAIDLDGHFGLHPAMHPLEPLYRQGEMLVLQAIAIPERTRSHFVAQDVLESGAAKAHANDDGWLNRALGLLPQESTRLGLAVGYDMPPVLRGSVPVSSWAPARLAASAPDLLDKLGALYESDPVFARALAEGRRAQAMTGSVLGRDGGMKRGNLRNQNQFGVLVQAAARLLAAPEGARIAVAEMGGWDTHTNQNNRLRRNLGILAKALAELPELLGPAWQNTVVMVATEFGRTVRINGTNGSDHGTATAAFLLGGAIAGGRVAALWPGLGRDQLHENRDLKPTSDIRGLFKTVMRDHFSLPSARLETVVFPNSEGAKPPPGRIIRL